MRVYLSYNDHDRAYASALREKLASLGTEVWNPDRDLLPGSNWLIETGRALERADGVIFLLSDAALRSPWSLREVEYAIGNRKYEGRVMAALVSPGASRAMPWILRKLPFVDASSMKADQAAEVIAKKFKSAIDNGPGMRVGKKKQPAAAKSPRSRRTRTSMAAKTVK